MEALFLVSVLFSDVLPVWQALLLAIAGLAIDWVVFRVRHS
jgi:hypothetical protein